MKEAGNAAILAHLAREFGETRTVDIFVKALYLTDREAEKATAERDCRNYVSGREPVLPEYVRNAARESGGLIADSL